MRPEHPITRPGLRVFHLARRPALAEHQVDLVVDLRTLLVGHPVTDDELQKPVHDDLTAFPPTRTGRALIDAEQGQTVDLLCPRTRTSGSAMSGE